MRLLLILLFGLLSACASNEPPPPIAPAADAPEWEANPGRIDGTNMLITPPPSRVQSPGHS